MQPTMTINETTLKTEAGLRYWWIAIVLLAFIPFIQSIITTPLNGTLQMSQVLIRVLSLVTMVAEMGIIMLALRTGFSVAKDVDQFSKAIKLALAILAAVVIFGFVISSQPFVFPALITLRYILQGIAFAAIIYLVRIDDGFNPHHWFGALTLGLAAYIAYLAIFTIVVPDYPDFSWTAMLPSATSVRHIGNYVAILAIAPAALFLFGDGSRKYGILICWIVAWTFIAWTGSRAALLGLSAGVFAAFLFTHGAAVKAKWAQLGISATGGVAISLALPNPDPAFGLIRMFQDTSSEADSSSGRIEIWQQTWQHILQHPWVGHQAGTFGSRMQELYGYDLDNPHNFVVQYLYDWGFVGGSAALFLIGCLAVSIFRRRAHAAILVFPAFAGMALLLSIGLLEGMLYHPLKMVLVMAMIAPLLGRHSHQFKDD